MIRSIEWVLVDLKHVCGVFADRKGNDWYVLFEMIMFYVGQVYRRMQQDGRLLVNFAPLPDLNLPHFFRAVVTAQPSTPHHKPYTLRPETRNLKPETRNPKPYTLIPEPKPSTLKPEPLKLNSQL